jgi:hypothetical protein
VLAVEKLRARGMGIEYIAEIHVQFGSPAGDEPTAALRASVRRQPGRGFVLRRCIRKAGGAWDEAALVDGSANLVIIIS